MIVQVCVGSSCHLKGSNEIVTRLQQLIKEHYLEDDVTLAGSFCIGKCNRLGVTIQIDDEIHAGVTVETLNDFFRSYILDSVTKERG